MGNAFCFRALVLQLPGPRVFCHRREPLRRDRFLFSERWFATLGPAPRLEGIWLVKRVPRRRIIRRGRTRPNVRVVTMHECRPQYLFAMVTVLTSSHVPARHIQSIIISPYGHETSTDPSGPCSYGLFDTPLPERRGFLRETHLRQLYSQGVSQTPSIRSPEGLRLLLLLVPESC